MGGGGSERDYISSGEREQLQALKVPRQCPLFLLVKMPWGGEGKGWEVNIVLG
jgi:hypothetical protein